MFCEAEMLIKRHVNVSNYLKSEAEQSENFISFEEIDLSESKYTILSCIYIIFLQLKRFFKRTASARLPSGTCWAY